MANIKSCFWPTSVQCLSNCKLRELCPTQVIGKYRNQDRSFWEKLARKWSLPYYVGPRPYRARVGAGQVRREARVQDLLLHGPPRADEPAEGGPARRQVCHPVRHRDPRLHIPHHARSDRKGVWGVVLGKLGVEWNEPNLVAVVFLFRLQAFSTKSNRYLQQSFLWFSAVAFPISIFITQRTSLKVPHCARLSFAEPSVFRQRFYNSLDISLKG